MCKIIIFFVFLINGLSIAAMDKFIVACPEIWKNEIELEKTKDMLAKAMERVGYRVEYRYLPTERALREADKGSCDGDFMRIKDAVKGYKNLTPVEEPLKMLKIYAYTINGDLKNMSWEKLKDYNVAVIIGNKYNESKLKGKMKKGKYFSLKSYDSGFKMMKEGMIDYMPMFSIMEKEFIENYGDIKRAEPMLDEKECYFMINKRHRKIAKKLAEAIKEVKKESK